MQTSPMHSASQPKIEMIFTSNPNKKRKLDSSVMQIQSYEKKVRLEYEEESKENVEFWNAQEWVKKLDTWGPLLSEKDLNNLQRTLNNVQIRYSRETCYPPKEQIFSAFQNCSFQDCRVVFVGQDPYIDENQAMGMCFSVPRYQKFPPSLRNIFKCIIDDPGVPNFNSQPKHGDLSKWAAQGVLLLNANLTVTRKKANSHSTLGWEKLTDQIINVLNIQKEKLVFVLWGNFAQKKLAFIDQNRHKVLTACHPSPLAANKGDFFTCKHFSKCNQYLEENGFDTIQWKLD